MNYKIAAIGSEDAIFPFRQIGIDVFLPEEENDLVRQIARLVKSKYLLFFIDETLPEIPSLLTAYDKHPAVTIIPIPGIREGTIGLERIQSMVEKALGQNIL